MGIKSFISGMFLLAGILLLMPFAGIKISADFPFSPFSNIIAGAGAVVISLYLMKRDRRQGF